MLTPFNQNWRTTLLPFSLALKNTVNTGVSFTTPSGAIANSQRWASAGFRGFGPVMTFPGAGMDGVGCHCKGMGQVDPSTPVDTTGMPVPVQNIMSAFSSFGGTEWIILGVLGYMLFSTFSTTKRGVGAVTGAVQRRRSKVRRRREREMEEGGGFFGLL